MMCTQICKKGIDISQNPVHERVKGPRDFRILGISKMTVYNSIGPRQFLL